MTLGPIRTYQVSIDGYSPALYCARSRGKATARAFNDFRTMWEVTFGEFLHRARVTRVPDPLGVGDRIMVAGLPATRVYHPCAGHYVWFMRDDSDVVLCSHPLDVSALDDRRAA